MSKTTKHLDENLARYGLTPDDLCKCGDYDGPTIFGKSGAGACVKPARVLETHDLDELKSWVGHDNALYEKGELEHHITVPAVDPAALTAKSINDMSTHHREALMDAAKAYVWGHSARAAAWKGQVEKHLGPFAVPVYAVDNITVKPGSPWIIDGTPPQVINVGTITVESGGEIIVKTSATVNGQTLDQQG